MRADGEVRSVRSKRLAHQLRVVFGILGLKAAELHGDLAQERHVVAVVAMHWLKSY